MISEYQSYYLELVEGKRQEIKDRLLFALLQALSPAYAVVMRLRSFAYATGLLRSFRLPKPVISVGNLTVGGTGKTPTVAWLCRFFLERGKRVAVLSRGYGGSSQGATRIVADGKDVLLTVEEAGDEPYLLASTIPGIVMVIGADRHRAGLLAMEKFAPDIFILDDGFQHQRLKRDLDILLLDCARPFHNGWTLPAGLLREPKTAIKRAGLVVFTRCTGEPPGNVRGKEYCAAFHQLTCAISVRDGSEQPLSNFTNRRGMAFAGIADPPAFFDSLEKEGLQLITTLSFSDHAAYGAEEIAAIRRLKEASRSDYLITTEKDAVKLAPHLDNLGNLFAARLELKFSDAAPLMEKLEKLIH